MIIELEKKYEDSYKRLVRLLWKDIEDKELDILMQDHYLNKEKIFIYVSMKEDRAVGFINTSIRNDYVPGATSKGVGYIEGIYVCEPFRRNQIAYKLVEHTKDYYKAIGITEIGSDTETSNVMSQIFHKAIGFHEVEEVKHYIMTIGD